MNPFTIASTLLTCLCAELEGTDAGVPCFCGLTVGTALMPVDSCLCASTGEDCGTAWVRLDSAYPSAAFPTADPSPRGSCTSPLAYRFHVGVVRCVPGLDHGGRPPNADAMALAAQRGYDDAGAAYRAALCCGERHRGETLLGPWLPVGAPDGNCAGGYWPLTVWGVR
jgi:hypothetical protein